MYKIKITGKIDLKMKIKIFIVISVIIVLCSIYYKILSISALQNSKRVDGIVEPIYTQDCFPRTLKQNGVSKFCFERANLGQNIFCTKSQIKKIEEYYQKGQENDPLNDGTGNFCAD